MENNFIIGEAGYALLNMEAKINASREAIQMAELLSKYMKDNNLTKKDIVERTGLSMYIITNILRGFHNMKLSQKHLIQFKLNINF